MRFEHGGLIGKCFGWKNLANGSNRYKLENAESDFIYLGIGLARLFVTGLVFGSIERVMFDSVDH